MIRQLLFYLIGRIVTPETIQHLLDEAVAEAKAMASRTATPLDDQAVATLERMFDFRALSEKLAAWMETRVRQ